MWVEWNSFYEQKSLQNNFIYKFPLDVCQLVLRIAIFFHLSVNFKRFLANFIFSLYSLIFFILLIFNLITLSHLEQIQ